jgi:hypothetical protein
LNPGGFELGVGQRRPPAHRFACATAIQRTRARYPDFPDAIAIIAFTQRRHVDTEARPEARVTIESNRCFSFVEPDGVHDNSLEPFRGVSLHGRFHRGARAGRGPARYAPQT